MNKDFIDVFIAAERALAYNKLVKPRHPKTLEEPAGSVIPMSIAEQIIGSTSEDLTKPTAALHKRHFIGE